MAMKKRALGCLKDEDDARDFRIKTYLAEAVELPASADLRSSMSPVKNQGNLGCHDGETEVLTNKGWKRFIGLWGSEDLATVNPTTLRMEFQKPTALIRSNYSGEMYHFNHRSLDCMVTPNHRMFVRSWNERKRKLSGRYGFTRADGIGWYSGLLSRLRWTGKRPKSFWLPSSLIGPYGNEGGKKSFSVRKGFEIPMEDWVSFLGIYLAEGCCYYDGSSYRVEIAAKAPGKREKVIEIVDRLPFKVSIGNDRCTIHDIRLFKCLDKLGNVYTKRIPRYIMDLDGSLIQRFLDAFALGDGSEMSGGGRMYYSVSEGMIDDLQELILRIGCWSTKLSRPPRDVVIKGRLISKENCSVSFELYQRTSDKLSIDRKEAQDVDSYGGEVFCAEVPNSTLVTRRNGRVTVSGNSCVGFASAAMKEWQEKVQWAEKNPSVAERRSDLSEAWIYWQAKEIDPWDVLDEGTTIRCAMKVLQKQGVPLERSWPYVDVNSIEGRGTYRLRAVWGAKRMKIKSYARISTVDEMRQALVQTGPFVAGVSVFAGMFSTEDGVVPMPSSRNKNYGGHAICICGYDDEKKLFTFKNSWGVEWGDSGYGYLPYDYMTEYCSDAWTSVDQ